jgi:hypothetical protein
VNWKERRGEGQEDPGMNRQLSYQYYDAYGKPTIMRKLVEEWIRLKREAKLVPKPFPPLPSWTTSTTIAITPAPGTRSKLEGLRPGYDRK